MELGKIRSTFTGIVVFVNSTVTADWTPSSTSTMAEAGGPATALAVPTAVVNYAAVVGGVAAFLL